MLIFRISADGQTVINGDFENNSAGSCDYNLPNATFNAEMPNTFAFGPGNELDIMSGCSPYCPAAQSGNWYISLANSSGTAADALSLTLSIPLVAGNSYSMSFWDHGENSNSYPPTPIEVGVSTVNNLPGTIIYSASTPVVGIWKLHNFSFVAPNNGQYLTLNATSTRWTQVDNVKINPNPLPVELLSFAAQSIAMNEVKLNWITASETNNDYFTVERSIDGKEFIEISKVDGSGNCNNVHQYEDRDLKASEGISYYRLVQTDFNGCTKRLKTVSVNNPFSQTGLLIYPNPVTDRVIISLKNFPENVKTNLVISDPSGKVLMTEQIMLFNGVSHDVSLNELPNGIYFLKVFSANAALQQKFLKE
jgi:hypothetical protein